MPSERGSVCKRGSEQIKIVQLRIIYYFDFLEKKNTELRAMMSECEWYIRTMTRCVHLFNT